MRSRFSPLQEVNLIAKLADLQEIACQNTVVLHAIMELLIQKGVMSKDELLSRARAIDADINHRMELVEYDRDPQTGLNDHGVPL
ncbi:hypothetical protein G3578_13170 [Brevibacillus sp. SYP-B805]|uniref:hypothetical protein n=1 Tax=Brevibacillus sp. SYP-B805 TaxID=1578199 RepID=UPI0013EE3B45|nr:hypothetical protein [Brevibacillus sp. SYP-B805]NGQ96110.1 hypothetical protein [Brevibacillus sp. SYP-B805]